MPCRIGFVTTLLIAWAALAPPGAAQDQCAGRLSKIADSICGEIVKLSGSSTTTSVGAGVEAKVSGLLGQLVDLGGSANVGRSKQEYTNILREDLPRVLQQGGQCRLEVVKMFFDRTCGQKTATQQQFNLVAVMAGYPKVANVFAGPGTQHPIIIKLQNPQLRFVTHTQPGDFWLVRMPRGRVGYMHTSRIRLLSR